MNTILKKAPPLNLGELIESCSLEVQCPANFNGTEKITGIEYDSRSVSGGSLFVAVEGFVVDGHSFVRQAVDAGAAVVVVNTSRLDEFSFLAGGEVILLGAEDTRRALPALSAAFYRHPAADMTVIGVTGTNGKTSITYMIESILGASGMEPGVIGTVNARCRGRELPAANTTPESRDIQHLLYSMKSDGVNAVVMEISSHALDLYRADCLEFNGVIFTNLTRDHLDYHKDFESYFAAKRKIFDLLDESSKDNKAAVVNADDPYGARLLEEREAWQAAPVSYGVEKDAEFRADPASVKNSITGLSYRLVRPEPVMDVTLQLAGAFHIYNSLAALSLCRLLGIDDGAIIQGLAGLETVPGRFDVIAAPEGFGVVVDYAHTGDALEKLLLSARELDHDRIITVFGCGGDRDRTKRPLMGATAAGLSDIAIVTSDNPRTEDPDAIIKEIVAGIDSDNYRVEPDRAAAIKEAVEMARAGDIVIIAGKGHEDYQILGTKKIHFDDRETARKFIAMRGQK